MKYIHDSKIPIEIKDVQKGNDERIGQRVMKSDVLKGFVDSHTHTYIQPRDT